MLRPYTAPYEIPQSRAPARRSVPLGADLRGSEDPRLRDPAEAGRQAVQVGDGAAAGGGAALAAGEGVPGGPRSDAVAQGAGLLLRVRIVAAPGLAQVDL